MRDTERVFISILNNYIGCNDTSDIDFSDIDFSSVDFGRLKELATIHRVVGIVYSCMKKMRVHNEIVPDLEMGFYSEIALYEKRKVVLNKISRLFETENIKPVILKGGDIAGLYPDPELRTMSDLDLLIREKDREVSHRLLLDAGAMYLKDKSEDTVYVYIFDTITIEVHTSLVSEYNTINGVDFEKYFSNAYDSKTSFNVNINTNIFKLNTEYNIIYMMFHTAKHFYGSGCGVRMLLDFPVLVRSEKQIDWNYIWEQFERLKLTGFAEKIFKLCEIWFGLFGVEYQREIAFEDREVIEDFIINGGVYGFYKRNPDTAQLRRESEAGKRSSYIVGIFKWAFPSYKKMRQNSPWFEGKPAFMLPVAYVERFVRNVRERGGFRTWIGQMTRMKSDIDEKDNILFIMDLKRES